MANHDDIVDPELVARLASWFGTGGAVVTTPAPAFVAPDVDPRLAELEKVIDPRLVARIEAWTTSSDNLLAAREPIEPVVDLSLIKLEVRDVGHLDGDEPEYWQPDDVREALDDHNTPQSVLRDLFRPVMYFGDIVLQPIETGLEHLGDDPTAAVRSAMASPAIVELDPLPAELVAADLAELREIMAMPWQDAKPETPTAPSIMPDYEHYMWFGVEGGYDPDV